MVNNSSMSRFSVDAHELEGKRALVTGGTTRASAPRSCSGCWRRAPRSWGPRAHPWATFRPGAVFVKGDVSTLEGAKALAAAAHEGARRCRLARQQCRRVTGLLGEPRHSRRRMVERAECQLSLGRAPHRGARAGHDRAQEWRDRQRPPPPPPTFRCRSSLITAPPKAALNAYSKDPGRARWRRTVFA